MRCDPLVLFPKGGQARFIQSREAFPILRRLQRGDNLLIELGLSSGVKSYLSEYLEPVPQVGDRVVVLAKPYTDHIYSKMQQFLYQTDGKKTTQYFKLRDELDDFEWMGHTYPVKRVDGENIVIQAHGIRRELPHWCVSVLRRGDA